MAYVLDVTIENGKLLVTKSDGVTSVHDLPPGPQGPVGLSGLDGAPGVQGPQGERGFNGPTGHSGGLISQ